MPSLSLRCLPSNDKAFAAAAREALDECPGPAARLGEQSAAKLETAYPDVEVRAADPIAAIGETALWYVFREGGRRQARTGADD